MGTICGIYNRKNGLLAEECCKDMMDILKKFPHDTSDDWHDQSVFLGCTNVYITPESKYEQLPFYDQQSGFVLTADAIIDNRSELLAIFGVPPAQALATPDSELILKAYRKWGAECPQYLIGDYAFAIWDENRKELFCARDHVGKRTFYYYADTDIFAFCTLSKPLLLVRGEQDALNDQWIANYLALLEPVHELDIVATVYEGILQLPPAHSMRVTPKEIKIQKYWDPLKIKKLQLTQDQEYEEAFRKVFSEAVHCRLRGNGPVGVMLSGGLDSGSAACIAAKNLEEQGKRLRAYSAIPFSEYKNWLDKNALADEREYIQAVIEEYQNIDIQYCDSVGINSYNSLDRLMDLLEHPFKFAPNFFWLDTIASQCSKDGCCILLDGQSGNYTVSFGDLTSFVVTMVKRGKWLTALKEIRSYSVVFNRNYLSILKYFLVLFLPGNLLKYNKQAPPAPINMELSSRWKTDKLFKKYKFGKYATKKQTIHQIRRFLAGSVLFSQAGEAETKLSLAYGILKRDPTRDKRVVEFCMSLPPEQFVKDGIERSLIRRAMEGILPDKVRMNLSVRGTQSADWIQRLHPEWKNIKNELLILLENPAVKRYVNTGLINSILNKIDEHPKDEDYYEVQILLNTVAIGRFLVYNKSKTLT